MVSHIRAGFWPRCSPELVANFTHVPRLTVWLVYHTLGWSRIGVVPVTH